MYLFIAEAKANLKNHSVQSDEGKLSNNNIEIINLLNIVIECRRMFHENKQGALTVSGMLLTENYFYFDAMEIVGIYCCMIACLL